MTRPPLEATHLRGNLYFVRPENHVGTCGWVGGIAWTGQYVRAPSAKDAVANATPDLICGRKKHATLQA